MKSGADHPQISQRDTDSKPQTYRVYRNDRDNIRDTNTDTEIVSGLPYAAARRIEECLTREVHAANPTQSSWTLPVFVLERDNVPLKQNLRKSAKSADNNSAEGAR